MTSQAEVNSARAELDRIRGEEERIANNQNGARLGTALNIDWKLDGNWTDIIIGDHIVKIEGGYQKVQVGVSNQFVFGFKGEFIGGLSFTLIIPVETKLVAGLNETKIYGVKRETIGGAKYDILHGIKFEKKSSPTITTGGAVEKKNEGKISRKVRDFMGKIGNLGEKVVTKFEKHSVLQAKVSAMDEKIKKLEEDFKALKEKFSKLTMKVGKYTLKCDSWKCESKTVDIKGAPFLGKGGSGAGVAQMNHPMIKGGGSYISCGAANVHFKGAKYLTK